MRLLPASSAFNFFFGGSVDKAADNSNDWPRGQCYKLKNIFAEKFGGFEPKIKALTDTKLAKSPNTAIITFAQTRKNVQNEHKM
jgi:hypothetical protein